jgi:hypothetical protein
MVTASVPFYSCNLGKIQTQVQAPNHFPDRADTVVILDQLLYIHGMEDKLCAVYR